MPAFLDGAWKDKTINIFEDSGKRDEPLYSDVDWGELCGIELLGPGSAPALQYCGAGLFRKFEITVLLSFILFSNTNNSSNVW